MAIAAFSPNAVFSWDGFAINDQMPDALKGKLSVTMELRYRYEYIDNLDFNSAVDDDDAYMLLRSRINVDVTPVDYLRAFVQLQDARIWDTEFASNAAFEDSMDIRQAFLQAGGFKGFPVYARVGRQEISYGDQRLLGGFNWSNIAQSFDAAKLYYKSDFAQVDVFAARKVLIDNENFNDWDDNDNLLGLYSVLSILDNHTIDLYYLFRDTTTPVAFGPTVGMGKLDESTVGFRFRGSKLMGFDYTVEAAYQFGNFGTQDISAYAIVALAGYTIDVPWSPRIGIEWDHASGDSDPSDGDRETFDNLFPTNHMHYGYMDRASLQNLNNIQFMLSAKPMEALSLQADLHFLHLDETSDSLYNAGRKPARTSATTAVDDHVGTELDLTVKYRINRMFGIITGYSHFFTGDFLSDTGASDDGDFFYFELTMSI
jgi:hypothetical protein